MLRVRPRGLAFVEKGGLWFSIPCFFFVFWQLEWPKRIGVEVVVMGFAVVVGVVVVVVSVVLSPSSSH